MSKKASIAIGLVVLAIIGLWLWTILIPKNYISIGGSTSVDPVMQRLTNRYSKENDNSNSFVYSSSGSRGGLSNTESGIYQMGFISRKIDSDLAKEVVKSDEFEIKSETTNPTKEISDYLKRHEADGNKFNYFQMGTDAVVLTYYPTSDFAANYADKFVIDPTNEQHQKIIYELYQGNLTWIDLAIQLNLDTESVVRSKLTEPKNRQHIIPFSRETGSGTRNSFEEMFNFKKFATEHGNPVPSPSLEFNSNGIMYTGIEAAVNSFGYLSLNYLRSIHNNHQLYTVLVSKDGTTFNPLDDENFENGEIALEKFANYPLSRPYIGLFKANLDAKILSRISEFLGWMSQALKEHTLPREIYQFEGLIPVMKFNFTLT